MGNVVNAFRTSRAHLVFDRKAYCVIGGLGLLLSLSVIIEICEKLALSDTPNWSAIRLMGPQSWIPIKTREDYNVAIIMMIYAIMYSASCCLLIYGGWKTKKDVSLSWKLCECGVLIYQVTAAIVTRDSFTTSDIIVLTIDTLVGLAALLYTKLAERTWPDTQALLEEEEEYYEQDYEQDYELTPSPPAEPIAGPSSRRSVRSSRAVAGPSYVMEEQPQQQITCAIIEPQRHFENLPDIDQIELQEVTAGPSGVRARPSSVRQRPSGARRKIRKQSPESMDEITEDTSCKQQTATVEEPIVPVVQEISQTELQVAAGPSIVRTGPLGVRRKVRKLSSESVNEITEDTSSTQLEAPAAEAQIVSAVSRVQIVPDSFQAETEAVAAGQTGVERKMRGLPSEPVVEIIDTGLTQIEAAAVKEQIVVVSDVSDSKQPAKSESEIKEITTSADPIGETESVEEPVQAEIGEPMFRVSSGAEDVVKQMEAADPLDTPQNLGEAAAAASADGTRI